MSKEFMILIAQLGPVETNCYIVINPNTKEAIVIDPADEADTILDMLDQEKAKAVAILLTHGHGDHIFAANEIKEAAGGELKIYAALAEDELLKNTQDNLTASMFGNPYIVTADILLENNQELELIGANIKCIHTSGHTKGSMCYYFAEQNILFSGDTLFRQSIGRTDLATGDYHSILISINQKLMTLPDETIVYSGHGKETTIGYERTHNPYIK